MNKQLLICTQKIDRDDPVLGFFHEWVIRFAGRYRYVTVICLEEGFYDFPKNVTVCSLGKEKNRSRLRYVVRFYQYIHRYRRKYDAVFVHMNEEYVLLGGVFWRFCRKRVALWRNHTRGSWRTALAVLFSHIVYCTSPQSYTARFGKTRIMPVGVDDKMYVAQPVPRAMDALLYVGRISSVKNIECLIDAYTILYKKGFVRTLAVYGPVLDEAYMERLQQKIRQDTFVKRSIRFHGAVSPSKLPAIYSAYGICVNMTDSGSFDKTIVESLLCGALPVVSTEAILTMVDAALAPYVVWRTGDCRDLANTIERSLSLAPQERYRIMDVLSQAAKSRHGLSVLLEAIVASL